MCFEDVRCLPWPTASQVEQIWTDMRRFQFFQIWMSFCGQTELWRAKSYLGDPHFFGGFWGGTLKLTFPPRNIFIPRCVFTPLEIIKKRPLEASDEILHKKLFCQAWALVSKTVFLFALWQILFELQSCKASISWLKENCLDLLDKVSGLQTALISILWTIFLGLLQIRD